MLHPIPAVLLAAGILFGYGAALWWLLRQESRTVWLGLVVLCGAALSLRVAYTTRYPRGLNEDEPKNLACAYQDLRAGLLFVPACNGPPVLLSALFEAPLLPVFGPNRWSIRTYSLVTSVLSVPAAFAAARALGLAVSSSFSAAALLAVLPWAVFFGRISLGGELIFHALLLVAALARLVWRADAELPWAGAPEVGIGGFGLCLLLFDYGAGRSMAGLPLVAAALARGRRRICCLLILPVAALGWWPYLRGRPGDAFIGMNAAGYAPDLAAHFWRTLWMRLLATLHMLAAPVGLDQLYTTRAAAMQPWLALGLAVAGIAVGMRRHRGRSLFLLAGFLGGAFPAVMSAGWAPSAHRMITAFPFIALAAACALDQVAAGRWRTGVCAAAVAVLAVQSVHLYFSTAFWPPGSATGYDWERSELVAALPPAPHPRLIVAPAVGYYFAPYEQLDADHEPLSVDNWFPANNRAAIYVFSWSAAALRPFYEDLFGIHRVRAFGRAFLVKVERADWSWLRRGGWAYRVECGSVSKRAQVPTLFDQQIAVDVRCGGPVRHVWRGRWLGPAARLRLRFSGAATVDTAAGRVLDRRGWEAAGDFAVTPGSDVTVTLTTAGPSPAVQAMLVEVTPAGERVPRWDRVEPISGSGAGGAAEPRDHAPTAAMP